MEKRILTKEKQTNIEIKTNSAEIKELKLVTEEIKDNINLIISDLKGSARKEDTEILKKYIQMWEPMHFLTRKEFNEKIEKLDRKIG